MISKKIIFYSLFLLPQLVWFSLILLTPYLSCSGYEEEAGFLFLFFRPTCHQLPGRSFFLFGCQLPVCARCLGIYFGALTATVLYPFILPVDNKKTPTKWLLIFSLIPIGLDGGLQYIQFISHYESSNLLRLITGFFCGGVLVFYLLPVYNELIYGFLCRKQII